MALSKLPSTHRIASIDILRGIVMIIMAIDHTRDFFHHDALIGNDPLNFKTTWPFLFFTRWITHYCAPVFVFLSGASVYLYAQRDKTKKQVAFFLFTRGLFLMFAEVLIINVLWEFNLNFIFLQVIWATGLSMVFLSALQFFPYKTLLIIGLVIVCGHNLLDGISFDHPLSASVAWAIVHQANLFSATPHFFILIAYPFLPWFGLMICGYCFGKLYTKNTDAAYRKKFLLVAGIAAIGLFIVLRFINIYGDRQHWATQSTSLFTLLDFVNTTKYPPSLLYMLMTIGPALIVLSFIENASNWFTRLVIVFGKVPFFYYILHVFLIHSFARIFMLISGRGTGDIDFPGSPMFLDAGYPLWVVYAVWITVIIILYFPCKWYGKYKSAHPENRWLTYL